MSVGHKPRETRGPIETPHQENLRANANRGCHKPRETRGPIETLHSSLTVACTERRHKPRETRGPIETSCCPCSLIDSISSCHKPRETRGPIETTIFPPRS